MIFVIRTTVRAPGVIKLFGEHAVVYGKTAVGATVNMYSTATTEPNGDGLYINLEDIGLDSEISNSTLSDLYMLRSKSNSLQEFISNSKGIDLAFLPFAIIAGSITHHFGKEPSVRSIIKSNLPPQRGFASSATVSVCFALSLIKHLKIKISDEEFVKLAREGEKIYHKSEGAGIIDVNTSYYGGFVSYSKDEGIKKFVAGGNINETNLILVDTGPKKSTAETVAHVAELMQKKNKETKEIIENIGNLAIEGETALKKGNVAEIGKLMTANHNLLKKLGVSSAGLDKTVDIAIHNGAYGAKLSGGGGGGLAIVLVGKDKLPLISGKLTAEGYGVSACSLVNRGAKDEVTINS
jgi:mevalonate kinase